MKVTIWSEYSSGAVLHARPIVRDEYEKDVVAALYFDWPAQLGMEEPNSVEALLTKGEVQYLLDTLQTILYDINNLKEGKL